MPSLKAIRKRIQSVKNTQKITRAMKMIATVRLRKAQANIMAIRPYANRTFEIIADIACDIEREFHPLLAVREEKKVMVLIFTSDKGLCGSFNSNIMRSAEKFFKEEAEKGKILSVAIIGKKGYNYFKFRQREVSHYFKNILDKPSYDKVRELACWVIEQYVKGEFDAFYMIYNEFKSVISQKVVIERLLPLEINKGKGEGKDYIFEPNEIFILDRLLPMYVEVELYRVLLESIASEYGARMTAMDNATENAQELIATLTLQYNKARQAAITKELLEVIGGAEALRKAE